MAKNSGNHRGPPDSSSRACHICLSAATTSTSPLPVGGTVLAVRSSGASPSASLHALVGDSHAAACMATPDGSPLRSSAAASPDACSAARGLAQRVPVALVCCSLPRGRIGGARPRRALGDARPPRRVLFVGVGRGSLVRAHSLGGSGLLLALVRAGPADASLR